MKLIFLLVAVCFLSFHSSVSGSFSAFFRGTNFDYDKDKDVLDAKRKKGAVKEAREGKDVEPVWPDKLYTNSTNPKMKYDLDLVLNSLRRANQNHNRSSALKTRRADSDTDTSSSSLEEIKVHDELEQDHRIKMVAALKAAKPDGDQVNMVAARPWGVPCGDPDQHDMPWGSCMLAMECESEYRIYRGDYFCGRTNFICCALQLHTYDQYDPVNFSFESSALQTDTDERQNSREKKRNKKSKDKSRRQKERRKRKRKLRKTIKKIVREIKKILNKSYKNGTKVKRKKTKELKKFINFLKRKYKNDRKAVQEIHAIEMFKVDADLMDRLRHLSKVNKQFMNNGTFRDIVLKGIMSKKSARMLLDTFPELSDVIPASVKTRRTGGVDFDENHSKDDIEFGYLYYG